MTLIPCQSKRTPRHQKFKADILNTDINLPEFCHIFFKAQIETKKRKQKKPMNLILSISNFLDATLVYHFLLPSDAKNLFDNSLIKKRLQSISTTLWDSLLLIVPDVNPDVPNHKEMKSLRSIFYLNISHLQCLFNHQDRYFLGQGQFS